MILTKNIYVNLIGSDTASSLRCKILTEIIKPSAGYKIYANKQILVCVLMSREPVVYSFQDIDKSLR